MEDFEAVYAAVRQIPEGKVSSYGGIGQRVGVTARTVGWALAYTPEDVPWQRVVGHDGRLPIGKRSPELQLLQRKLLTDEGVAVSEKGVVAREFFWEETD